MERRCGDCQLCCTLLPVKGIGKLDGVRCKHQRSRLDVSGPPGCAVYHAKGFPIECGLWSCRWLADDSAAALDRPDRSHYVIDIVPDFITVQGVGGPEGALPIIQVWIDPRYPDAHRDPAFREWVVKTEPQCGVLVRYNARDAIVLIPPHMSDTGEWEEIDNRRATMNVEDGGHSAEEIAAVLFNSGAMK
jgi:hypothetical protein